MAKSWKETVKAEFAKVPKNSPFSEYQKALKRASRVYHGATEPARVNPSRARATRANPRSDDLLMLAVIAAMGYVGWRYLRQHPEILNPPAATAAVRP
ncbi:MAG: hypothetical protein M1401_03320 [Chloroflexi bacterium]|nr:hypothetical protein [Chloroflexota bacterium]